MSTKGQNFKAYRQRGIRACVKRGSRIKLHTETGLFEGLHPWRKIGELPKNSPSGNREIRKNLGEGMCPKDKEEAHLFWYGH